MPKCAVGVQFLQISRPEVPNETPPLVRGDRLVALAFYQLRQCIFSRRYPDRINPHWISQHCSAQFGGRRNRHSAGDVCYLPAKWNIINRWILWRSNQPVSPEPDGTRKFQSWTTLRDDHHRSNYYLILQSVAPFSIRYDELVMATYLITGIAGFIGSSLARAVLTKGGEVRGIDNLSTGKTENMAEIRGRIDFREADLLDMQAVQSACTGVDYVLHQAAIPSVPKSVLDPVGSNRANVDATVNLLVAARDAKVKRVVYAASSSAYGDTPVLPKHEDMPPNPISPYAVAKLASEYYMISFYRCYGLETVCLRYFNIFGPRQDPTSPYSGVLAKFVTQMLKGEQPTIFGDGSQSRDFTYIDNAVEANLLACKAPAREAAGQIFNVATGKHADLNETFRVLKKLIGYPGDVKYAPERAGDVKHSLAEISRAEKHLGYKPTVNFEEGLRRTIDWYRNQPNAAGA
jgi:UDP-N-acetylglucosamine/UDP-N-acetyl-alpha-D-glucosaminouronate 4-epimerase